MELKVGDIVRFGKMQVDYGDNPIYATKDDLFEVVEIVLEKRFYSGIGIYIKSVPCPTCKHHNKVMIDEANENNGFDSGWFEKV